jgi:hypothetical protein
MLVAAILYFAYERTTSSVHRSAIWAVLLLNIVAFNSWSLGSGAMLPVLISMVLSSVLVISLAVVSLGSAGADILGAAYALSLATSAVLKYAIVSVSYLMVDIDAGAINGIFTVIDIVIVLALSSVFNRNDKLELLSAQVSCVPVIESCPVCTTFLIIFFAFVYNIIAVFGYQAKLCEIYIARNSNTLEYRCNGHSICAGCVV